MFISRLLCTQVKAVLVSPWKVMNIPKDTGNTITPYSKHFGNYLQRHTFYNLYFI